MESNDFCTNLNEYIKLRAEHRTQARELFYSRHKDTRRLIAVLSEAVAEATLFLSEESMKHVEHGQYISRLVVSYCRSFFISLDLLADGDLIESVLIVRKQLELVSRLHELVKGEDLKKLINQTPNLKHLTGKLKKQYSNYSMIAHSSNIQGLALLGNEIEDGNSYVPVYPKFQDTSFINLQHIVVCTAEFFIWLILFYQRYFPLHDFTKQSKDLEQILLLYDTIFPDLGLNGIEKIYRS